jgi:hypothetical protein
MKSIKFNIAYHVWIKMPSNAWILIFHENEFKWELTMVWGSALNMILSRALEPYVNHLWIKTERFPESDQWYFNWFSWYPQKKWKSIVLIEKFYSLFIENFVSFLSLGNLPCVFDFFCKKIQIYIDPIIVANIIRKIRLFGLFCYNFYHSLWLYWITRKIDVAFL